MPNASYAAGAARPGSTSAPAAGELLLDRRDRPASSSMPTWPMCPDPEQPRDELAVPAGDGDTVTVAEGKAERDRIDPIGGERAGEHGGAVVVGRVELEAHLLDPRPAGTPERAVAGEGCIEAAVEHEAERLDERDHERRRRGRRRRPLCLRLARWRSSPSRSVAGMQSPSAPRPGRTRMRTRGREASSAPSASR